MRRSPSGSDQIRLPLVEASRLWHIGSMDYTQRGVRGTSLEGNLFSVSACPQAWRSIARLGGGELHSSRRPVRLLDMLSALQDPEYQTLRDAVTAYGLERGLLKQVEAFKAIGYDDELDREFYSLHETREAADDESVEVEVVTALLATESLKQIHALPSGAIPGLEYAMIEWLRERVPALPAAGEVPVAGVYWDEDYAPGGYSAPRGGLFNPVFAGFESADHWPSDREALRSVAAVAPISSEALPGTQTITLYHGTNAQFDCFSLDHSASGTGTSVGRLGIWLAQDQADAKNFGDTLLTVEASWFKPYPMPIEELAKLHKLSGREDDIDQFFDARRQHLLELGYDSIAVLEGDGSPRSVVALDPASLRIIAREEPQPALPEPC